MVTITLRCAHCDGQNIVRNCLASNGKQRYLCPDCGRQCRDDPTSNAYSEERLFHSPMNRICQAKCGL